MAALVAEQGLNGTELAQSNQYLLVLKVALELRPFQGSAAFGAAGKNQDCYSWSIGPKVQVA
jgi:hypothetical protein